MIFIELKGRLGNQMFQFAFGKLLEKNRNIKVFFLCPKTEFRLNIFDSVSYVDSSNFFISLIIRVLVKFHVRYHEYNSCLKEVSLDSISDYTYISGYFQSSSIFESNRGYVRSLFNISSRNLIKSNDCVIHIRKGDYLTTIFEEINSLAIIPEEWFVKQLGFINSQYSPSRLLAIGDDYDCLVDFCKKFRFNITPEKNDLIDDFVKLMSSRYLIISNSSFAWWAAFLNIHDDSVIVAPKNWVGYHVNIEYPKGIMTENFLWR